MTTIDARGLSCPEPVILASQAMKSGENAYEIKVDNRVSKENVANDTKFTICDMSVMNC